MSYKKFLPISPLLRVLFPFSITPGVQGGHDCVARSCARLTDLRLSKSYPPPLRGVSKGLEKAGSVAGDTPHGSHGSEVEASPGNVPICSSSWAKAPCRQNPIAVVFAWLAIGCGRKKTDFDIRWSWNPGFSGDLSSLSVCNWGQ